MEKNSNEGHQEQQERKTTAQLRSANNQQEKQQVSSTNQQAGPALALAPRASPPKAPPHPRQPRALQRPNLRRQVIVAAGPGGCDGLQDDIVVAAPSLELTGVLPATAKGPIVPPKRPTRLPARYATGLGIHGQVAGGEPKPNRYSWAQMQHWQQAAAAAAAANEQQTGAAHQGFHHHFSGPFSSAASRVLVVNPMQIVNLSEHTKSRLIKSIEAIKRLSEKWFSHVLLLLFLAVYACFGAYIFISFEAPTEHWEKRLIIDGRLSLVNESWHEARHKTQEEFLELFRTRLEDYERLLNRACASGMTSSSLENQWTFWGGLFYSMTVFTTIGYGHLTPITFAGRVATMVYAIFGIPILLMVLADLGKLLTRIIKYAFKKFRYLFNKLLRRKSSLKTRKLISDNTNQYIGAARDAFERGFAYMQHQPAALRVNSLKQRFFLRQAQQQRQPEGSPAEPNQTDPMGATLDLKAAGMEESSDIIVTPAKQTKPVSPPIGGEKKSLADPAIQSSAHTGSHNTHNNHHHHNNHHQNQSHRAQSPAFRIRRKVSTSGLMASRRHHQLAKGSLSKSSSSNVVGPERQRPITKKLSDASNPPPSPSFVPGPPMNDDKPKCDPSSRSDVNLDATTTGATLDVVAGFEMDEDQDQDQDEDDEDGDGDEEVEDEAGAGAQVHQDDEDEMEDEFDIPVSFALFLLVTYMMFGAVVFSIWEGWNFFDSLYFVFISMSTIGFGDLVPQHPKRMIGTFIYLLFGLALTSMCINVVQEKIHATFLRAKMQIGEKMGFDLDQIMADDYYDGSLVYDVEGAELADDSNSLAVSQTNSATGAQSSDHHHQHHQLAPDGSVPQLVDPNRPSSQSLDGTQPVAGQQDQSAPPAGGLRQSKSKESLKGKKRGPATGLPGQHWGGANASSTSGSLKRKPSKRMSRQTTPSSASTTATAALPSEQSVAASGSGGPRNRQPQLAPTTINVMPLRSQVEVHKLEPMMLDHQQQPGINAPINNVKNTCEPLRVATRDELWTAGNRPKLTTTRSLQPNYCQTDSSGRRSVGLPGPSATRPADYIRAVSEAPVNYALRRPPIKSSSYQSRSDLEAALSRRSSVSNELNQLDDLIVALGRSPRDKFGPLLGIPSSARSSRSNSPLSPQARRGTSMTSRPSSGGHQVAKNASVSSIHNMPALNLSESQAALEELEAVKFRF